MIDKETRRILKMMIGGCCCESYYSYQCCLCRLVGETKPEVFADLVKQGLVEHGSYSPYKLTQAGKFQLEESE